MQVEFYPHPVLTFRSVDVTRIDETLRRTVRKMFDLMYEANGIGLAANQVGLPFRMFVINLAARPGESDQELVFLNPVIRRRKGEEIAEEGCLSLPGLYGDVRRSATVVVDAFDLSGQGFALELDELAARAVQHETDHLDGVLFTDRMRDDGTSAAVDVQLPKFAKVFRQVQKEGRMRPDELLLAELQEMVTSGTIPPDFPDRPPIKFDPPQLDDSTES